MRALLHGTALVVVCAIAACGGDSSSGPKAPSYPAAAGTYTISGGFDDFTQAQASFTGTVTVNQASREAAELTGSANITATVGGDVFVIAGPLSAATVTTGGALTYVLVGTGATWSFTGNLSGVAANGRHTLTDGSDTFSGAWAMNRPAAVRQPAALRTSDPAAWTALIHALR